MNRLPKQVLVINAWSADTTEQQLRSKSWGGPLSRLMLKGHRMELSLPAVPRFLAERLGNDTDMVLAMFEADPKQWEPDLGLVLSRYGHRVNRWHVGRAGMRAEDPDRAYRRIASTLNRYVADPQLVLPTSAQQPLPMPAGLRHLRVRVPVGIRPAKLPEAAGQWPSESQITALLQTYPATGVPQIRPADRATDLALRMVWTKVAKAEHPSIRGMAIERPWTHRIDPNGNERIEPDPLLVVWDNLTNRLGGRRVVGSLRLGADRSAYLLEDASGRGTLVAWAHGTSRPTLSMQLGRRPVALDIWGNRRDVSGRPYLNRALGVHHVRLGPAPLFIESIDLPLMKLRTGFALTPNRAEAKHAAHRHTLKLQNPWPHTLSGTLRLVDRPHWKIEPRLHRISIPPGQTLSLPLQITFPINETIGTKKIKAVLEFESSTGFDRTDGGPVTSNRRVVLEAPLKIDLKGYHLQTRVELAGSDVLIHLRASRDHDPTVDRPSYYLSVAVPGQSIRQGLISRFAPGDVRHRVFRIRGALPAMSGRKVLVSLRQIRGPALLNTMVEIP